MKSKGKSLFNYIPKFAKLIEEEEARIEKERIEEDGDDGESVEEHEVADGTKYYLGSDGTLYDVETQDIVGTLNEETNSLVPSA